MLYTNSVPDGSSFVTNPSIIPPPWPGWCGFWVGKSRDLASPATYFSVAARRFDGATQRLRISIEEEGLAFLADSPLIPSVTPDRLATALSLMADCGLLRGDEENGYSPPADYAGASTQGPLAFHRPALAPYLANLLRGARTRQQANDKS